MFSSHSPHSCSSQLPPNKPFGENITHEGQFILPIKKIDNKLHHLLTDITVINTTTCRLNTDL